MSDIGCSVDMPAVEFWRKMDMCVPTCPTQSRSIADSSKDVALLSNLTALSTVASIIQQIHYATGWVGIKQAQFDKALLSLKEPSLAFGGVAEKIDIVLFYIRKLLSSSSVQRRF